MQRNRENAQLSRQRKKAQMEELAARCAALTQHNAQLAGAVRRLTAENAQLRQQLALVCQATKGAAVVAPQPGAAAKPAAAGAKPAAPAAAAAKPATAGAAPAAKPAAPSARPAAAAAAVPAIKPATATDAAVVAAATRGMQWPLLPFGFLPRVGLPGVQRPAAAVQPAAAAARQQQQQQQRAAAAAKPAAPAKAPVRAAPEQPQRASKRARTASGASAAFLALLSVFMIAGLGGPRVPTRSGEPVAPLAVAGSGRALQALPDPAALHNQGRSLAALPAASSGASQQLAATAAAAAAAVEPRLPPLEVPPPGSAAGPGGVHLQQLLNSTLQALLLEPGNAELEAAALARLQELGPVALLLDADDARGGGANPLAASAAFPQLAGACVRVHACGLRPTAGGCRACHAGARRVPGAAKAIQPAAALLTGCSCRHCRRPPCPAGQLFGAAGLEGPQVCRPVLEFDAASVPHAMRSRRSLERFILGATGFRGRSLAAGPAAPGAAGADDSSAPALPGGATRGAPAVQPAHAAPLRIGEDGEEAAAAAGVEGVAAGSQALLPAGGAGGPVLVSVLLPANASEGAGGESGGGGAKLAASDKVFVVLLHPRQRYVAYSCALSRPVVL